MRLRTPIPALIFLRLLALQPALHAQITQIAIPAGSPEDQALESAANEADAAKRIAMYQEVAAKFPSSPTVVAYAWGQVAQLQQNAGDLRNALASGDKALAAVPNNLDLLATQVSIAQQTKEFQKLVDYASRGGEAFQGIGSQPKPANMTADQFAGMNDNDRKTAQPTVDYLEGAAYGAIASEPVASLRLGEVERFQKAFPRSKYSEQVTQFAIYSLQQMNDPARAVAYGEKLLAKDPNSIATLVMLAGAYADEPKPVHLDKAIAYARKVIEIAKPDDPGADNGKKLAAGVAYSSLGLALMKQEKTVGAVTEFKKAVPLLRTDAASYNTLLYRLGYAYAKLKRYAEAKQVLAEAVNISGPYQQASREMLAKVNSLAPR